MKTLYLDTSDSSNINAKVDLNGKIFEEASIDKTQRPESILLIVEKLLEKADIKLSEIDSIKVKRGPGSFTGLKVGVSVANALSFALGKSVNEKSLGDFEEPQYS